MVCFQGVVLTTYPAYNEMRRSPVYIFYRSIGFSSAGNVLPVFSSHFDELSVRERARLPLPAEWGLPQVNSPPNFFRRAEGAAMSFPVDGGGEKTKSGEEKPPKGSIKTCQRMRDLPYQLV